MKKQTLPFRELRKLEAAERTAWNRRSIHDREAAVRRIVAHVSALKALSAKAAERDVIIPVPDLDKWIIADQNRYARHAGLQNKYVPHQGARECARRVWQSMSTYQRAETPQLRP